MIRIKQTICGLPLFYNTFEETPGAGDGVAGDGVAGDGVAGDGVASNPPPKDPPANEPKVLTLTPEDLQKKVTAAIDAKAKEHEGTISSLMEEMKLLKTRSTMNAEERKTHDARVRELENKLLTTEELSKRQQQKIKAEREQEAKALSDERDFWSNLYKEERVIRGITDASTQHKAVSPEQMVAILGGSTELVERELPDGKKAYDVMTSIQDVGDDGKPIMLKLEVSKALEHMSQQQRFFNLFQTAIKSGFNGTGGTGGTGGEPTEAELAKDPNKWREYSKRKRGKIK